MNVPDCRAVVAYDAPHFVSTGATVNAQGITIQHVDVAAAHARYLHRASNARGILGAG